MCQIYSALNQKSFYNSIAHIQGYTAYIPKLQAIVIAFRGSVDLTNWLFNLNQLATNYSSCSGCQVHLGFYSAFKTVAPLVKTAVDELQTLHKGSKIIFTGHSLGGAMAVLCALNFKETYNIVGDVYTFGQPRVGNKKFADFLENKIPNIYRVINYADAFVHVPPSAVGYKHGGH
jgi:predicted lipase